MANFDWVIITVDALRIKGKPAPRLPSTVHLVKSGVPVGVAQRWATVRRQMTVGLKQRVNRDRN